MDIQKAKEQIIPIIKKYNITKAALFGSIVTGKMNEKSDVDILVEIPKGKSLFDVMDIQFELEDVLKRDVDLVEYHLIKPRLRPYIMKDQINIL